jgi:predicted nicotinamide N-methyase
MSQEDVGFALWPASLPLSRWIVAHAGALLSRRSTRVLEIGAGVGLTGIVAALASPFSSESPSVWLTDFNPRVLDNLARNASLNEPSLHHASGHDADLAAAASATGEPRLRTARDDWSVYSKAGAVAVAAVADVREPEEDAPREAGVSSFGRGWETALAADARFDLILGSDMICSAADATGVSALIAARLAPHGVAVLLLPPTDVRYGVDALPSAAAAAGLEFETHPLSAVFLAATFEGDPVAAAREADFTTASGYEPRARLWFLKHAASS